MLTAKGIQVLDWDKRMKIAIGSAKGLAYLHEDCKYNSVYLFICPQFFFSETHYVFVMFLHFIRRIVYSSIPV